MTNSNSNNSNEDIRALLAELTRSQIQTQQQIRETQQEIRETQQETNRQIQETQQEIRITQEAVRDTQEIVRELTNDVTRVLGRSAILDDVLFQLRENQQIMQANFNEHQRTLEEYRRDFIEAQRTTNAALNSLEAINLRLIEIIGRG